MLWLRLYGLILLGSPKLGGFVQALPTEDTLKILATIAVFISKIKIKININSAIRHITFLPFFYHCVDKFCLHYSTGTHKTTMFIYGRVGQPSHRAVYST